MSLQICLADKTLGTVFVLAWEGIVSLLAVRLHVRFVVVAAAEELAAAFDIALKVGFLFGGEFPRGSLWALPTRAW